MGERRAGRFRLGRRRQHAAAAEPAPCVPCGQQAALRPFALNQRTFDRIDEGYVATLDPEVAYAIADGEVVLFDGRAQQNSLLNASAALIWASIDGTMSVAAIADDLALATGADRAVIVADVRETVARFIDGGVVVDAAVDGVDAAAPVPVTDDGADDEEGAALDRSRSERRARRIDAVLDRRSWQLDEVRRCAGATVAIRTDSVEVAALLAPAVALLAPADPGVAATATLTILDRGPGSATRFRVLRGTETIRRATSADEAFDGVFSDLNDLAINETADRVVLHAGAVERDGSVVLVAGPSGRGKSTLTAALVQAGWAYLTDEVAAVDPATLGVLPYPKPLDLDADSCALLGIDPIRSVGPKGKLAVEQVGVAGDGGGRVDLLVLLDDPNRSTPAPTSAAERLVELLGNTFASTYTNLGGAQRALDALAQLAIDVPVLVLGRVPIADAVRSVDEHLAATGRAAAPATDPPTPVAR